MKPRHLLCAAAALVAFTAPAAAQNSAAEPPIVAPPPPAKAETPPANPAPPPTTSPPSDTVVTPAPVIVTPPVQTMPAEPVTISPDAAYPNGFADPNDPFANDMSLAYRQQSGFDWGLLGLLGLFGLLGLAPMFRRERSGRTVYVERDDVPPRRVVRTDRVDEE